MLKKKAVYVTHACGGRVGWQTDAENMAALKIALGAKHFALYLVFVVFFSLATGFAVNLVLQP